MPRELGSPAKEDHLQGQTRLELTKSPDNVDVDPDDNASARTAPMTAREEESMIRALSRRIAATKRDELHPYTGSLTLADVASCVRIEEEAFPPHERCTREKFQYRLRACGELSLGIFTSHVQGNPPYIPTTELSSPAYSGTPERKAVLIGLIVATQTTNPTVTDDDMRYPAADDANPDSKLGHKKFGRTLCIHSLAVLPQFQRHGLGRTLMQSYLQRMESHGVADRAALIAHDHLITYYESFGFVNKGYSAVAFGGGGWYDMVKEFRPVKALMD